MSNLTYQKLLKAIYEADELRSPVSPRITDFLRPRISDMPIFESSPPPPRIQVREITFNDGTPILRPEFRAKINAKLAAQFGYQDDPFKDKAYIMPGFGIVMNKRWINQLNTTA